jgi:ATP-binding cassette, subfamily B, bacterial
VKTNFLYPGIKRLSGSIPHLIRALRLAWNAAGGWTAAWVFLLLIQGLLPVAIVYLTRVLVDTLTGALGKGLAWANFQPVLAYAMLMAIVLVLTEVIQVSAEWIRTYQSELVQDHISALVQDKSVSLDLAFYEMPEFHDHLYRARSEASTRPLALLESSGNLLQNSITLFAMAAVLIPYGIWVPPALLISTIPAFYVVLRSSRRYYWWWKNTTADRRRVQYYDFILTESAFAPEMRLFQFSSHFQTAYRLLRRRLRGERLNLLKEQSLARLGAETFALVVSGGTLIWMLGQALRGLVTLGDIALFYQAFQRGQGLIRALVGNLGQIYTNSLYLGNLFEFLELKSKVVEPQPALPVPQGLESGISFRSVTFRYPGSDRPALKDLNLMIPAGKIVAIVGANGAGKTTLLKLICRFYDPDEGCIAWDSVDLRKLSLTELRSRITYMSQIPVTYQTTARENIILGSLQANPDMESIQSAVRSAGAEQIIARLPRKYDNILGKWFAEGTELSAGEWQRIAMSRAFLRKAQIIVLDEPTSMMDSWSENDWFERLRLFSAGRTAVLITHRLTIAMRTDFIFVMMNGVISESGTHQELLAAGGQYARSWYMQTHSGSGTATPVTQVTQA